MKSKKRIYVCVLSTNNYLEGVLILAENLRRLRSKFDLLCLINETITDETKATLDYFNINYLLLPSVEYNNQNKVNPHWMFTFDKLNLFKLMDYEKIVYLDSDFLILENLDHLFDYPALSMPRDIPFHKDRFCSCAMVIKPNMDDYNGLVELAKEKNKEGEKISDQDVINEYFNDIKELPEEYNAVRIVANYESEYYIPIYNEIRPCNNIIPLTEDIKEPKIVHYIGPEKPFMVKHDFDDTYKYEYYSYLNKVRKKVREFKLLNCHLISIVIPLYNKEKYIKKCLDSILKQTYTNLEVLIVDDKSTDRSLEICREYADKDERIKVIALKENCGVSHARNIALYNAEGKYVAFIDADDSIEPKMIETLHYLAEVYQAEVAQCSIYMNGKPVLRTGEKELAFGYPRTFTEYFYDRISSVVFDKLIRRDLIENTGLRFREDYKKNEDKFFVVQTLERTNKVVLTCDCLYNYTYQKKDSLTGNFNYPVDRNLMEIIEYTDKVVDLVYDYLEITEYYYANKVALFKYFFNHVINSKVDKKVLLNDPEFLNFLNEAVKFSARTKVESPYFDDQCDEVVEIVQNIKNMLGYRTLDQMDLVFFEDTMIGKEIAYVLGKEYKYVDIIEKIDNCTLFIKEEKDVETAKNKGLALGYDFIDLEYLLDYLDSFSKKITFKSYDYNDIINMPNSDLSLAQMLLKTIYGKPRDIDCKSLTETSYMDDYGNIWGCCPSWIEIPFGNILEDEDVYRTYYTRIIRLSELNKTYCFCNTDLCRFHDSPLLNKRINPKFETSEFPKQATVAIDKTCNLRCDICRKKFYAPTEQEKAFTSRITDRIIEKDLLNKSDILMAGQGEVFFSVNYDRLLQSIKHKDRISILSNGILFTEEKWNQIKDKFDEINVTISIDAATQETYEKVRRGPFNKLMKNLEMLGKLRKEKKLHLYTFNFVVQKANYHEMPEMIRLAKRLNADAVQFTKLNDWQSLEYEEYLDRCMIEDDHLVYELYQTLKDPIFKDKSIEIDIRSFDTYMENSKKYYND